MVVTTAASTAVRKVALMVVPKAGWMVGSSVEHWAEYLVDHLAALSVPRLVDL